ncbi:MAG: protein-L-isoaspartate(D-aspartate) O-methyltransferase [Anaerolineales bacterium]|nr:protein-L-isoaspartate(D-aspartate) O-methyltransferase [Anaerolineales bacterium]
MTRVKGGDFDKRRQQMIDEQIVWRGIKDSRVLDAMRRVPRHLFVPPEYREMAYMDGPLRIGEGQTISQPYIVALMTELLNLKGDETVLEVGTGSGYQAAILGELAANVHTIERHELLASHASAVLKDLGYDNIYVHVGDGTCGLPEFSPFDAIIITAAAPEVPQPLLDQLADEGRLVLPVGGRFSQVLERWQREGDQFNHRVITSVAFVPLLGEFGWHEDKWRER